MKPFSIKEILFVITIWIGVGAALRYALGMNPVWAMLFSTVFWFIVGWPAKSKEK